MTMRQVLFWIGLPLRLFGVLVVWPVLTMGGDRVTIRWRRLFAEGFDEGIEFSQVRQQ